MTQDHRWELHKFEIGAGHAAGLGLETHGLIESFGGAERVIDISGEGEAGTGERRSSEESSSKK